MTTDPKDAEIARLTAERDAALAREAALLASIQANRDLLYQLTGAQSEVTHMRNRFDTAVATARAEGRKEGLREAADVCVCIRQDPETAEDEAIGAMMCASAILAKIKEAE